MSAAIPQRYIAYLTTTRQRAAQLPKPMTATQVEWIMFSHNGIAIRYGHPEALSNRNLQAAMHPADTRHAGQCQIPDALSTTNYTIVTSRHSASTSGNGGVLHRLDRDAESLSTLPPNCCGFEMPVAGAHTAYAPRSSRP